MRFIYLLLTLVLFLPTLAPAGQPKTSTPKPRQVTIAGVVEDAQSHQAIYFANVNVNAGVGVYTGPVGRYTLNHTVVNNQSLQVCAAAWERLPECVRITVTAANSHYTVNFRLATDEAAVIAHHQKSPIFSSERSCEAIALNDAGLCDDNECLAVVWNNAGLCTTNDCFAIVWNNAGLCNDQDCQAVAFGNAGLCQDYHCVGITWKSVGFCQ